VALGQLETHSFPGEAWSPAQLLGQLHRAEGISLLLVDGDRPCAHALGWAAGGVAELLRIGTEPADRRRGLGRQLLLTFVQACHVAGAEELWLEVRADNAAALALYRSCGLATTGRRPRYYADGTDAVLMGRLLEPQGPLEPPRA